MGDWASRSLPARKHFQRDGVRAQGAPMRPLQFVEVRDLRGLLISEGACKRDSRFQYFMSFKKDCRFFNTLGQYKELF